MSGETDHGNTAAKVDGEVDASWSSDFKDRAVKSSPPPEDIEYATAPAEQQGDEAFEFLPDGLDADDLTDLQVDIIQTAVVRDPDSFNELGRMVGCSGQNANKTLSTYAPKLAEEVKMDRDEAVKHAAQAQGADEPDEAPTSEAENDSFTGAVADGYGDATTADPARALTTHERTERAIAAAETVEEISENLEARKTARHIRRILEGGDGDD